MSVTINDILYAMITLVLPLALRYLYQLVSTMVADSRHNKAVEAVYDAVAFVNQTFVDSLKESGCFDDEAAAQALSKAKTAALDIMEAATYEWLEKTCLDLDEWLTVKIEAAVIANKKSGKAVA